MPEFPNEGAPPELVLTEEYDDYMARETEAKGLCYFARVASPTGDLYPVFFMDPYRILQQVEQSREGFVIESGLIVLPAVTKAHMERAVLRAWEEGFFTHLQPLPRK